jgi:hypothetical protein
MAKDCPIPLSEIDDIFADIDGADDATAFCEDGE